MTSSNEDVSEQLNQQIEGLLIENDTSCTSACENCGWEGSNLNICNKCKGCNAAFKKNHRSKHKRECERRVDRGKTFAGNDKRCALL